MSGLFGILGASVKALSAQSSAVETASRNLSNVNNANYARQRIVLGDRGTVQTALGAQSLGLEALGIEQLRDKLLDQQVVREVSAKAAYEAEQTGLQNAQAGLGESIDRTGETTSAGASGDGTGVAAAITNFFNSFASFAASPTDPGERQTLVQQAGVLADRMRGTDTRLAQAQNDLTSQANSDVADANTLLSQISALNDQIGRFEINRPGSAVDLRDQRQAKLEELATKFNFETRPETNNSGRIQVYSHDSAGSTVVLVDFERSSGSLTFDGDTLTGGNPPTELVLTSGSIKGAINARDNGIQNLRDNLDALAAQMVTSVNAAYAPSGGTFFTAGATTAATFSLSSTLTATTLKATTPSGAAGDNDVAKAVANLTNKVFSTTGTPADAINGTFAQHYSKSVSNFGQSLATATANVKQQTTVESMVRNQRDSISGVSLDEEMADLLKYQRSFQASSRVVSIIDQLLDTVVNRMGL